jgi:hypothetical protein
MMVVDIEVEFRVDKRRDFFSINCVLEIILIKLLLGNWI